MADTVRVDADRQRRTGLPEAVLASHKDSAQAEAAIRATLGSTGRVLVTRLDPEKFALLPADLRAVLDYDPLSRTAMHPSASLDIDAAVGIVVAGTSDLRVAAEASRTLAFHGVAAQTYADVGVAGLWRLLELVDELSGFPALIAVAGMEGALFAVLGGLVPGAIVAVPTSVGYGVTEGGRAALATALGACSPGVVAVNVDNGYGAATAVLRVLGARSRA